MVKTIICFFCVLMTFSAWSQPIRPTRTTLEITLDGKLTEQAWAGTEVFNEFIQCYPAIGAAPTERTEVRILYNDTYLYIGVNALDSVPSRIIATGRERDIYYGSDDHICVTLDTYNDKRQGILFSSNVLGARFDEEVFDNGNGFNASYNTFWNVKSYRHESGYSMEFQIPFSSLRFQQADEVVMGLKVVRSIKHRNEFVVFPVSDATIANAVWRINNTREIIFSDLKARKPFYLIPYAKADYSETRLWNAGESRTDRSSKVNGNIGFDIKYGISKNFTLDVTANTDFAQAETDDRILNFTRFAINLPEKRNFFLESKDYLGFTTGSGMLLFNSRSIGIEKGTMVPIIGGVRLTGKSNGLQLGFLDLQTRSVKDPQVDPQHFSVLRLRKEVWGNGSFVGGIFTNRMSTKGNDFMDQTVAFDVVRRFKDNHWVAGANAGTTIDNNTPTTIRHSTMANVVLSRVAALGFNHSTSFEYAGKDFRPQSGFAPDSAYVLTNVSNGYIWRWKDSPKRNLYWITHVLNHKYRTINATHESAYTELELGTSYKSGANILLTPFAGREYLPYDWNFRGDIAIPTGYYIYPGVKVRYDSRQTRRVNYSVIGQVMGFYSGQRSTVSFNGYYAINRNFRFTYKYEFNSFDFPRSYSISGNPTFGSNLVAGGLAFTQSIYFSAKALVQYDDISKTVGGNFRIRFNPKEGTDFYIVYNPRVNTAYAENRMTTVDQQTFIIKFAKAFSL